VSDEPDTLLGLARQIEELARGHACYSQVHEITGVCAGYIRALHRIEEVNRRDAMAYAKGHSDQRDAKGQPP
jgi:hypothetical protein